MDFVDQYPAITAEDIDNLERRYGMTFPADLRRHYLNVNGGHLARNGFQKNGEYYAIEDFLAIRYGSDATSFEQTYDALVVNNDRYPDNVIPFAYDASGDYFLCVLGEKNGQVWFFESEFYDDPDRAWTFLANTFQEFLEGLVPVPDD